MNEKLILIGGGGHCKACIDVIEQTGNFEIAGILDQQNLVGQSVLGYSIIGTDSDIPKYVALGYSFLITIGQIKSAVTRKKLFTYLEDCKANMAIVISPMANVSKYAKIGSGTILMHRVTINVDAKVGVNCILNTGCNIEHDAIIGNHVHVSTHAVVNGDCEIGDESFIGSNATISSQTSVYKKSVVGTGAVVIKDINEIGVYAGNPAKKIN